MAIQYVCRGEVIVPDIDGEVRLFSAGSEGGWAYVKIEDLVRAGVVVKVDLSPAKATKARLVEFVQNMGMEADFAEWLAEAETGGDE